MEGHDLRVDTGSQQGYYWVWTVICVHKAEASWVTVMLGWGGSQYASCATLDVWVVLKREKLLKPDLLKVLSCSKTHPHFHAIEVLSPLPPL